MRVQGRRRESMGRNAPGGAGWTELFFLDEVTALAAGHRPCFFCRRERSAGFRPCYAEAFGVPSRRAPDRRRCTASGWPPAVSRSARPPGLAGLPDGAMVADGQAYASGRQGAALVLRRLWEAVPIEALVIVAPLITPLTELRLRARQPATTRNGMPRPGLDPRARSPIAAYMRANYRMQRLFVPADSARADVRGRPRAGHYLSHVLRMAKAPSCWSSTAATANGWRGRGRRRRRCGWPPSSRRGRSRRRPISTIASRR